MSADRDNLLDTVYFIRYGASKVPSDSKARQEFLDELQQYRQRVLAQGRETVSVAALRGWLTKEKQAIPKRSAAMVFLDGYLHWIQETRKYVPSEGKKEDRDRKSVYQNTIEYLTTFQAIASQKVKQHEPEGEISKGLLNDLRLDVPLIARVKRILASSAQNRGRSDAHDLFEGGRRSSQDEVSYYLMYRYSTNCGNIMKSLLVLERPTADFRSFGSFTYFSRGIVRDNQSESRTIFRECEGLILPFERSFYLVGYAYNVRARKNVDEATYQDLRLRARQHPDGICVIAVEYEDVDKSNGVVSGLIMAMAGENQPVIARIALLHLGTKSALNTVITDHQVVPWEGPDNAAGDELQKTLKRLNLLGNKGSGAAILFASGGAKAEVAGEELLKAIRPLIDNTPAWEVASYNPSSSGRGNNDVARGALETYGLDRPRD